MKVILLLTFLLCGCDAFAPPKVYKVRVKIVETYVQDALGENWITVLESTETGARYVTEYKWGKVGDEFLWSTYYTAMVGPNHKE